MPFHETKNLFQKNDAPPPLSGFLAQTAKKLVKSGMRNMTTRNLEMTIVYLFSVVDQSVEKTDHGRKTVGTRQSCKRPSQNRNRRETQKKKNKKRLGPPQSNRLEISSSSSRYSAAVAYQFSVTVTIDVF
jgi:hypothetical protein